MSAEFPFVALEAVAEYFDDMAPIAGDPCRLTAVLIRLAIQRHQELQDRCVMDRTEASLQIANLRHRLREVDPQFGEPHT